MAGSGPLAFGWCMDGYHESCPSVVRSRDETSHSCVCPCHAEIDASVDPA